MLQVVLYMCDFNTVLTSFSPVDDIILTARYSVFEMGPSACELKTK